MFGLALIFLFSQIVEAAPLPTTSTSKVASQRSSILKSTHGFTLDPKGTDWGLELPERESEGFQAQFRQSGSESLFTVRVDEAKGVRSMEAYQKKWPLLYRRLGFQVLDEGREIRNGEEIGVVDLLSPNDRRRLRQYIFFRRPVVIIFTCSDTETSFGATKEDCEQLLRSFRWDTIPKTPT